MHAVAERPRVHWLAAATAAVGILLVMVGLSFAWVAVYSHLINPGHDAAFYQAYAQGAAPVMAVLSGAPSFFLVARWFRARFGSEAMATAMAMVALAAALDIALTAAASASAYQWLMCWINIPLKAVGAWLGARQAR